MGPEADRPNSAAVVGANHRVPTALWVAAGAVGLLASLPVIYLALRTASAGEESWDLLFRARTAQILGRSALLVITVSVCSVVIAVPTAWLTLRTDLPFRRVLSVAAVLPLVIPSYVIAMVAVEVLGPRGMLQRALEPIGVDRLPSIYGLWGATLTVVLVTYPYVLLTVRSALRRMDPALEEAARSMSYGAVRAFVRVTLPMLRPAIAAGVLLAALYALSEFGAVSLLRYETFTSAIYVQYGSAFDRTVAASLAMVLVVVAIALLAGEDFTRGKAAYHRSSAGAIRPARSAELGAWRWPAFVFVMLPVVAGLLVPVAILLHWLARGIGAGQELTSLWAQLGNSLLVALLAAIATTTAAVPVALLAVRYRSAYSRTVERVTHIGFGLPGIVVAISLVFFGVNIAFPLYQTTALLVFAYGVLFLPAAVGALTTSLMQVSPHTEEAALALGKTRLRALYAVTLPLVAPGLLAGATMVFLLAMKELPATLILSPIGFQTLATSIWSSASESKFTTAAAPALLVILAAGIPTAYLVLRGSARSDTSAIYAPTEAKGGDARINSAVERA